MTVDTGESPAFSVAMDRTLLFLRGTIPAWESYLSRSLPLPEWALKGAPPPSVKLVKSFLVGALEDPCSHTWWPSLSSCSLEDRTSLQGTLFLARKMLPCSPSAPSDHRARVLAPPPMLAPGYIGFVRKTCFRLLRGWDRKYQDACADFVPKSSACLEVPASEGGVRKEWTGSRLAFQDFVLGSRPLATTVLPPVRFMNVEGGGKSRSVTVASADQALLGPMHKVLYNHLSQNEWLLRGEAKPARFRSFVRRPGHVFVSGDYEAATDNLSVEVAEAILDVMRRSAHWVPESVFSLARSSLRARVLYPDSSLPFDLTRGQLMGNYLSFPLLCLQNYCCFRFAVSVEECPDSLLRINGDDIVFRSTRDVYQRWAESVSRCGLVLSRGKTLVYPSVFSLNSTFFRAHSWGVRRVPVIRSACLQPYGAESTPHALGPAMGSFAKGFRGEMRVQLETFYLRWRRAQIVATGRSVLRDLRIPVSGEALKRSGLLRREAWYLGTPPLPLPVDKKRLGTSVPEGWRRIGRPKKGAALTSAKGHERLFWELVKEGAWNNPCSKKALAREAWLSRGYEPFWVSWRRRWRRRSVPRYLRGVVNYLKLDLSAVWSFETSRGGRKVWVPVEWEPPVEEIRFVAGVPWVPEEGESFP